MSNTANFVHHAQYNKWINTAIYSACEKLSSAALHQHRDAYFGSIMGTLNHIMVGDILWLKRFANHPMQVHTLEYFRNRAAPQSLSCILHADLSALVKERQIIDDIICDFTAELSDEFICSTLNYKNSKGIEFNKNSGRLLQHLFNHQTHHRGQVSTLLYQAGIDVGVTDMLAEIPDEQR